jgi:hypothetical protein
MEGYDYRKDSLPAKQPVKKIPTKKKPQKKGK